MANEYGSALSIDFGSVHTRALLFDVVDGVYRLVSRSETRSTDGFPWNDLAIGMDRALKEIEEATGRTLNTADGTIISPEADNFTGVDTVSITASVGRPLRAILIGLMPDVSIASALRATAGTYIDVAGMITLDDGRTEEQRLNTIMLAMPDIIFIVGGTESGAQDAVIDLSQVAHLAISLLDKLRRPNVIYAGNSGNVDAINALFGDLTNVLIADNLRPSLDVEELDSARLQLAQAFDQYKETNSESFAKISEMSKTGVLPTAQSFTTIVEYLGKTQGRKVIAVDMGSSSSIVAVSIDGHHNISIRTDIGLGHSAELLLGTVTSDAVKQWLPFYVTDTQLKTYVANKALRPATVSMDLRDIHIEHALLKAGISKAMADARPTWQVSSGIIPFDMVIASGNSFTNLGNYGYTTLLLLDAIQPGGITQIKADPYGVVASVGAIALQNPEAVVQLMDGGTLDDLGTVVCPTGKPRQDKNAVNVTLKFEDGETLKETVKGGHLWHYPIAQNEVVEVRIKCAGNLTLNGKSSVRFKVTGGKMGLIIDARGRPIALGARPNDRAEQIPMWISELTGDEIIPISERWLTSIDDEMPDASSLLTGSDEAEEEKSGGRRGRRQRAKAEKKARRGRRGKQSADDVSDDELDELFGGDLDDDLEDDEAQDELGDLRSGILS